MSALPMHTTAADLALMSSWGVAFGERRARSHWPYERLMQAAQDDAVTVADQDMTVDGQAAEPCELRAAASLVFYGLAELVPGDPLSGPARLVLTEAGREQLARWARYEPLAGGER